MFVTLNFPNVHDPLTAKFAGLDCSRGLSKNERATYVAEDAYACAKYHHFLADKVIEYLFNFSVAGHKVKSGVGVLGQLEAIYAVWETQN